MLRPITRKEILDSVRMEESQKQYYVAGRVRIPVVYNGQFRYLCDVDVDEEYCLLTSYNTNSLPGTSRAKISEVELIEDFSAYLRITSALLSK